MFIVAAVFSYWILFKHIMQFILYKHWLFGSKLQSLVFLFLQLCFKKYCIPLLGNQSDKARVDRGDVDSPKDGVQPGNLN